MSDKKSFTITREDDGIRLDRWIKRHRPEIPHSMLNKLLRKGAIRLDGKKAEANTRLSAGQEITLPQVNKAPEGPYIPKKNAASAIDAKQQLIKNILYQDENLFIINKPTGLATQGGSKVRLSVDGMLEHLVLDGKEKPRLVHRLDKDTSGVLVIARTRKAATLLGKIFQTREVEKTYWAVVVGLPMPQAGKVNLPIVDKKKDGGAMEKAMVDEKEGKKALTLYQVVDHASDKVSWVALKPVTGRMHQLRVHMQAIGHPILADGKYGGREAFIHGLGDRMHLHARSIYFPDFYGKRIEVKAPLPPHIKATFTQLGFSEKEGEVEFLE
jgi:23S rRNA pseudouridine955/2504/2580 synthase